MYYHAKLEYSRSHYWWNYSKDDLIGKLLIPFMNGQVVLIKTGSNKRLLNLNNASRLTFYETEHKLKSTDEKSITSQIAESSFDQFECTESLIEEARLDIASPHVLSLLQKSFLPQKNQVFVIMKFNDKILESAYEGVIKPSFEKKNIKVIRVDELQDSGKISDQVLELIAESKYIFSDLTGSRPNCYYETGFAHALGKEIILSCKSSDDIHFDLAGYRFIIWETESELRKELNKRIKALINSK